MFEQKPSVKTFIGKQFETLVLSKSQDSKYEIVQFIVGGSNALPFYQNLSFLLQSFKNKIKSFCCEGSSIQQPQARKIVNVLMYLTKDFQFLLNQGILNIYMDIIEVGEKLPQQTSYKETKIFLQSCVRFMQPLLYEFFVFREYKKKFQLNSPKIKNSIQLVRNFCSDSNQDQNEIFDKNRKISNLNQEDQIKQIREKILKIKLNELLGQFLNEYEMQLNELEQICKICSKKLKINDLKEHVQYCQKKYILNQNVKNLQINILGHANQFIVKRKKISIKEEYQSINQPLKQINQLNPLDDKNFDQLLYQIINFHKTGSSKKNTSKEINFQAKIQENSEKYKGLIQRFQSYLQKNKQDLGLCEHVTWLLETLRQILNLTLQLKTIQLQYQNLKQIVSPSTIKTSSRASYNTISEKKQRFACTKQLQTHCKHSSNSFKNHSQQSKANQKTSKLMDFKDQMQNNDKKHQFCRFDYFDDLNFDQENLRYISLKTKQSFGNYTNIHFYGDSFETDQIQQSNKPEYCSKILRKIKSMEMFDNSHDSENQQKKDQKTNNSQSNSKPGQIVSINDFQILKFLGKGAFGKVYVVRKKNTQDLYAFKMIDIGENWGAQEFQQIRNEHLIFKKVAGEHLVEAPFCFREGGVHVFMMEFMPGGDLSKVLEEEIYLQESRAKHVIAQMVLAIQHLHDADIIHRDLKPENLVIDERGHLKLTDFGLSQIKLQNKIEKVMNRKKSQKQLSKRKRNRRPGIVATKEKAKIIGTPDYIAPQIINGISINNKSIDWWSLGVIAYEILVGVRPFCGNSIEQVLDNILKFTIEWPQIGEEDGMISKNAYDFIQKLLDKDFINRLGSQGAQQIKSHPFFKGLDWQNLKHQPSHIMPNYAKIRQLMEMRQNLELRREIQLKAGKNVAVSKMSQLDNFIRFDILGQKTIKEAQKLKSKKKSNLKRLKNLKQWMVNKQNKPQNYQMGPFGPILQEQKQIFLQVQ